MIIKLPPVENSLLEEPQKYSVPKKHREIKKLQNQRMLCLIYLHSHVLFEGFQKTVSVIV